MPAGSRLGWTRSCRARRLAASCCFSRSSANLSGLDAIVVGRSNIVGKPMAQLLLQASCTVTVAHSRTRDLAGAVRRADIVVAAVGRPELIRGDWLKPGATVIDVGQERVEQPDGTKKLLGDVAFDEALDVAGAITPVPGGVGPMTIACLTAQYVGCGAPSTRIRRSGGTMITAFLLAAAPIATAVDAEIAFARDAKRIGQWTAFRKWADRDAVMFTPKAVWAQTFLKTVKDPPTVDQLAAGAQLQSHATAGQRSTLAHGSRRTTDWLAISRLFGSAPRRGGAGSMTAALPSRKDRNARRTPRSERASCVPCRAKTADAQRRRNSPRNSRSRRLRIVAAVNPRTGHLAGTGRLRRVASGRSASIFGTARRYAEVIRRDRSGAEDANDRAVQLGARHLSGDHRPAWAARRSSPA